MAIEALHDVHPSYLLAVSAEPPLLTNSPADSFQFINHEKLSLTPGPLHMLSAPLF